MPSHTAPAAIVFCVIRIKDTAIEKMVEEHPLPQRRKIPKDQTIRPIGPGQVNRWPLRIRFRYIRRML